MNDKILLIGDSGVSSGYGRITDNIGVRLHRRGFHILGASFGYDGLLPAVMDGQALPYHVASLQLKLAFGQDWVGDVVKLVHATQPDVVMVCQDAPYAEAVRNAPIDWSRHKFVVITPVDGVPIAPQWVEMMKEADGALSISQFGVDAYLEAGVDAKLCRPGINPNEFYQLPEAKRLELREQLGVSTDAFILGTMAQNQGRKAIPLMLEGFFKFAKGKPNAFYLLDMAEVSPAGWNIKDLCTQNDWDYSRLIFRRDVQQKGIHSLRDRYNLLDAHVVLSHREGYGLPLPEAMACGVVSMALDYCSGPEVVGDGRGMLVKAIEFKNYSTWGGAMDYHPDVTDFVAKLNALYSNKALRQVIAQEGMKWSRAQSWDMAVDAVYDVLCEVLKNREDNPPPQASPPPVPIAQPVLPPDGLQMIQIDGDIEEVMKEGAV
jgi:glycosyltransferase involved in cell wall biosynthesis